MKIAHSSPFAGKPSINTPSIFGATTGKPILYRIPVTGIRPINITAKGLVDGLVIKDGIISGTVKTDASFFVYITAKNSQGLTTKRIKFIIAADTRLLTPLMGFTSWNAFGSKVSQSIMEETALTLIESGLADYGYSYVNIDSGWQYKYGGEFDAVMPNPKFPDMKNFCEKIHSMGLKCGIYSTPMLKAWGCPEEYEYIPGCTRGEPDPLYACRWPIGVEKLEKNNVIQWDEWGFDYLKYDWTPCDPTHADRMKRELLKAKRDFAMCVTVNAKEWYWEYWRKNCTSWRCNGDSLDRWDKIKAFLDGIDVWKPAVCGGHYFDLDMMETGATVWNEGKTRITEEEALFAFSMRAFFQSPIQLSCDLQAMSEFEFDLYTNDEVIGINQDALSVFPERIMENETKDVLVYKRKLENGDTAYAVFNMSEDESQQKICFDGCVTVHDLWLKKDVAKCEEYTCCVRPHCAALFRTSVYR